METLSKLQDWFYGYKKNIFKKRKERKKFEKREVIFPLIGMIFQLTFIICMCIEGIKLIEVFCITIALIFNLLGVFYLRKCRYLS